MPMPITKKGHAALMAKLQVLKAENETIPGLIATAREKGDLKENADYHAARERQGMIKAEMDKLSFDINNAQIIDPAALPSATITFGKRVKFKDLDENKIEEYTIVGPAESDASKGFISVTSPLAKSLLGKKPGDKTEFVVAVGTRHLEVLEIGLMDV